MVRTLPMLVAVLTCMPLPVAFGQTKPAEPTDEVLANRPQVAGVLRLHMRERRVGAAGDGQIDVVERTVDWNVAETAIIVCDMWDDHRCRIAAQRVGALAPRMNQVLTAARDRGVMIIHAPSETMDFYADTPYRKRMQQARPAVAPVPIERCARDPVIDAALLPVDPQLDCDDPVFPPPGKKHSRQNAAIDIIGFDGVSDDGQEIYNFCEHAGIKNIVLMGVHTNWCILARPFGVRQMVKLGRNVVVARDLTDALYDPREPPYVSHARGTELVVEHIERHWCPTIVGIDDLTRVVPGSDGPFATGSTTTPAKNASSSADVRERYSKREFEIPMRDGAKLFTAVYSPRDASRTYPIILYRTQSGVAPYGEDQYPAAIGPSSQLAESGYIFVYQDIRGRFMSDGDFVVMRPHIPDKSSTHDVDESSDAFDTIEWLLANVPNHNGRVGYHGSSYRGWLALCAAVDAHPALKAVVSQAPIGDTFVGDDWHHNGALMLNHTFFYMPRKGPVRKAKYAVPPPAADYGTPDAYDFFLRLGPLSNVNARHFHGEIPYWNTIVEHGAYDDYWKSIRLTPHLKNVKPAMLMVGGWYDAEDLYGTLLNYHELERRSPHNACTLVMGPWIHGGWNSSRLDGSRLGPVEFGSPTAEHYRAEIEFPFFEHHLKSVGEYSPPETLMFETGANLWRDRETWPPRDTEPFTLYFHPRGKLLASLPPDGSTDKYDEYVSDPAKPVPYIDQVGFRMIAEFMSADQRFAAARPDVLVYETEPLVDAVTLAGPLTAELHVSTSGTDSDWIVKLVDVYPGDYPDPEPNPTGARMGGYQQLVRGEVMRGKFRNSLESPEPFVPDEPTAVKLVLPDVYHTFRPGHRIMVQVQSSWFPLVDRNPQKFVDIYHAVESDYQRAIERVYRSPSLASRIVAARLRQRAPE